MRANRTEPNRQNTLALLVTVSEYPDQRKLQRQPRTLNVCIADQRVLDKRADGQLGLCPERQQTTLIMPRFDKLSYPHLPKLQG